MEMKNSDWISIDPRSDDEFNFLDESVNIAIKNAQQSLISRGISYVYSLDNLVIQHNPDGSEDILHYLDLEPDDRSIIRSFTRFY
jgi:hypothetical protein